MNSVLKADEFHQNWEMVFCDDGSKIAGEPIVREVLGDKVSKVSFVNTNMSFDDKLAKGLIVGSIANSSMRNSDADLAIILCDDDELHPQYLKNLSDFFQENQDVDYCYSKIHIYNPLFQDSEAVESLSNTYNQFDGPIDPAGKVDATQVAWRISCFKEKGAMFTDTTKSAKLPMLNDIDRSFFQSLYKNCGLCHPTGFVAQYKGVHDYQLLWHKSKDENDLRDYNNVCEEKGGVEF